MPDYIISLNETEQAGFDYQSSISGESVQDMIQRRVSEIGVALNYDLKLAKAQDLIKKIQEDPDAYAEAIRPIHEAKIAAEEALKVVQEHELSEFKS